MAALLPVLLGACSGGDSDDSPVASTADANTVVIRLVAFKPETLSVKPGAKVTWQQDDAGAHTVTSGTVEQGGAGVTQQPDDRFDSGEIAKGETFTHTFDEAGTYKYFCRLHPATMRGEIQVR